MYQDRLTPLCPRKVKQYCKANTNELIVKKMIVSQTNGRRSQKAVPMAQPYLMNEKNEKYKKEDNYVIH